MICGITNEDTRRQWGRVWRLRRTDRSSTCPLLSEFKALLAHGRFTAIIRLIESGKKKICKYCCTIYGTGLSEEAIWKVAQHHKSFNQVHQNTTFVEVAAKCQGVYFKHLGNGDDDGSFNPVVPQYNTTQYQIWKRECISVCQIPNVVGINYIIIRIALFTVCVYICTIKIFNALLTNQM